MDNNDGWIFAINNFSDVDGFFVIINSKDFWNKNKQLDDDIPEEIFMQMDLACFGELECNIWEPTRDMTKEEAKELMEMNGFEYDLELENKFSLYKRRIDNE